MPQAEPLSLPPGALDRVRFRFSDTAGLAIYPPGATFGPRELKDYEFVWIIDGEVTWEANGVKHPAPPGTIILSTPDTYEQYFWDSKRQTRHGFFHFMLEKNGAKLPPEKDWPKAIKMPDCDILRPLFRHISWLLNSKIAGWEGLAQSAARHLLLGFLSGIYLTSDEGRVDFSPPLQRALLFVQERWSAGTQAKAGTNTAWRNPTLGELARAAAVSEGHLCRLFRHEVGFGPLEALRMIRVDRAASLLARTNLRVKEISDLAGFENPFHFSRCFRMAYGVSPRNFRARAEAGQAMPLTRVHKVRRLTSKIFET